MHDDQHQDAQQNGRAATAVLDAVIAVARADSVERHAQGTQLSLSGVYSADPAHPNHQWMLATPHLSLRMTIAAGRPAADFFEQGAEYEIVFRKRAG